MRSFIASSACAASIQPVSQPQMVGNSCQAVTSGPAHAGGVGVYLLDAAIFPGSGVRTLEYGGRLRAQRLQACKQRSIPGELRRVS